MDATTATRAFGALAQDSRLEAFRLLVRAGEEGLPAGEIARALAIPHNTLSSHLSILTHAGLVASRRDGRSIIYRIDFEGTRALLAFLMEDCCQGRPDLCAPLLACVQPVDCGTAKSSDNRGEAS
ncbi:MAG: helix-turn-helix transcriptional regulator [Dongiaceae bacterium]